MAEIYPLRALTDTEISSSWKNWNEEATKLAKTCSRAEIPSLDHLSRDDYNKVYEPSDDTFLLLDAINVDYENYAANKITSENTLKSSIIENTLEIGGGTGVATIFLAQLLASSLAYENQTRKTMNHYVTDINPDALKITLQTAKHNQNDNTSFQIKTIQCDLASDLLPKLTNMVDILLFNPPYVPTPDSEVGSNGIEASWAGGTNGRIVLDRALPQIAQLLKWPNGVAYVITVDENFPQEIADIMHNKYGIIVRPFVRRRAWNEFLTVQKMTLTRPLDFESKQVM